MAFHLRNEQHANAFGKDTTTWVVEDDAGNRIDVWPALGFNAFHWSASAVSILDCDPTFFEIQKPTRSGYPILFPFPNRIRDGKFTYAGRDYQLPLNCPTKKNAIHGFVLNETWTPSVSYHGDEATLRGVIDVETPLWPAEARLIIDYVIAANSLEIRSRVEAKDKPLPFGIGYHPYFSVAPFGGDQAVVTVAAEQMLEQVDNLPTGKKLPPEPAKDMRGGKPFGSLTLDDAYTTLKPIPSKNGLGKIASIAHPSGSRRLDMSVSPDFGEFVAFTPPHRRAIALEPYTCMTDAINLPNAGWRVLPAGQAWEGVVRLDFTP